MRITVLADRDLVSSSAGELRPLFRRRGGTGEAP